MDTVADLMSRRPETARPADSLASCLDLMGHLRVQYLPIVDDMGRLVALAEEAELRRYSRRGITDLPVGQVAVPWPTAYPEDDAIRTLARQLSDGKPATVVIDHDDRPVGLITEKEALSLATVCLRPWMTVQDVAQMGAVQTVPPDETAKRALKQLEEARVDHLVVVGDAGVRGVVGKRELTGRDEVPVATLLGPLKRTVPPDLNIVDAIKRLSVAGGCLPVVGPNGEPLGVLTGRNVVRALTRQLIASSTAPPPPRRR